MQLGGNKHRPYKSYLQRAARGKDSVTIAPPRRKNTMADFIRDNINKDGIDRRGFLQCMAWAGTGVLYTMHGGILKSLPLAQRAMGGDQMTKINGADFSFIQISDSHIRLNKDAN